MHKLQKKELAISVISVLVFLLIWEIVATKGMIDPLFSGTPSKIAVDFFAFFSSAEFFSYLPSSLSAFFIGLGLAIFFGLLLGMMIGLDKRVEAALRPYVFALNSLPLVAIIPLMIIWFGIGAFSKTLVVFLVAVIPIVIAVADGVKTVDGNLVKMAESFGVSKLGIAVKVVFFHALPNLISSVRVAVGRAMVGLLAAEFFGFGKGIGYLISLYGSTFEVNKMMALVLMVIGFNVLLVTSVNFIEKRLVHWV